MLGLDRVSQSLQRLGIGHIALVGDGVSAATTCGIPSRLDVDVDGDDLGPFTRAAQRGGFADPAPSARDQHARVADPHAATASRERANW
jgi:hypothetical protein